MLEIGISVLICTYNGSSRLSQTLGCLATQEGVEQLSFEVIVVDNASTDNTQAIAQSFSDKLPLRVLSQPKSGKKYALELGIAQAQYDFILVCDDDNWLDKDYLKLAHQIMCQHPQVGILGGCNIGAYEVAPPSWLAPIAQTYAIGECHYPEGDITHTRGRV